MNVNKNKIINYFNKLIILDKLVNNIYIEKISKNIYILHIRPYDFIIKLSYFKITCILQENIYDISNNNENISKNIFYIFEKYKLNGKYKKIEFRYLKYIYHIQYTNIEILKKLINDLREVNNK